MPFLTSSDLTKRNQSRIVYADYLIQKQRFESGCSSRIQLISGSGADTAASSYIPIVEGPLFITPAEQTALLANNQCPAPPIFTGGSMLFVAGGLSSQTNVSYPNDADLRIGTQSFTIEWFQFYEDSDANAIVFSIGTNGTTGNEICVVYQGTTLYVFTDSTSSSVSSAVTKNIWQHVAVVGNGGADGSRTVSVYVNGTLVLTRTANYNLTQTDTLRIGNQTDASVLNGNYAGRLANFRWVVGTQVYTNTFTPPTAPLTAIAGTQLLLLASTQADVLKDSSVANRTPTNTGVVYNASSPF